MEEYFGTDIREKVSAVRLTVDKMVGFCLQFFTFNYLKIYVPNLKGVNEIYFRILTGVLLSVTAVLVQHLRDLICCCKFHTVHYIRVHLR